MILVQSAFGRKPNFKPMGGSADLLAGGGLGNAVLNQLPPERKVA